MCRTLYKNMTLQTHITVMVNIKPFHFMIKAMFNMVTKL